MNCNVTNCIYNASQELKCILDEAPSINDLCMCDACTLVSIDDSVIEAAKKKELNELRQLNWQD